VPFHIEEIFAFLATEADGEEGVVAWHTSMGWMPLVAADKARLDLLRRFAQEAANATGRHVTLARFHLRHDTEVIVPEGAPR